MKFRAKILDISLVQLLHRAICVISKQTKQIVVKINAKNIFFLSNQSTIDNFCIFAQIPSNQVFQQFTFEGIQIEDENQILFILSSQIIFNTLKQIHQNSKSVLFKLVQKETLQFIQIIIEQPLNVQQNICVTYDLPIQLIPTKFFHLYNINVSLNNDSILNANSNYYSFIMPPLKNFKSLIDKIKTIQQFIQFMLKEDCLILELNVSNQSSNIKTQFIINSTVKPKQDIFVNVDIKRLSIFFNSLTLYPSSKIQMCILNEQYIHLTLLQDQILVHFKLYHHSF